MNKLYLRFSNINFPLIILVIIIYTIIPLNFLRFSIISRPFYIIALIFYFIISLFGIIKLYKGANLKSNLIIIPFIAVGMMFLINNWLLNVPIIFTIPVLFSKLYQATFRIFYGILLFIILLVNLFFLPINSFGEITIISESNSPNGDYRLVEKNIDEGALGGNKQIILEDIYLGVISKPIKIVYKGPWGENINLSWIDDESFSINGQIQNVGKIIMID